MRHTIGLCSALVLALITHIAAQSGPTREISLADLRDKIEGGWAGQMIGVSFGAPTEFRAQSKMIEGDLPEWKPERIANAIEQDDLYVDMTFAKVLDDKGLDATTADFGAMFREAKYSLWHANLAARRALKRGVPAGESGMPKHNAHANDIDFQIEADFIGMMAPGLPQAANRIADQAGRVMNYGDGLYGGMFVAGMYSAAFFENDPHEVVATGLACIPAKSPYAQLISDVIAWHEQNPGDWKKNWQLIEQKWNKREPCPGGAMSPFNIDAKINGAYIVLGLLYGDGDFAKTMEISTRAGQDSDCNPSSAAGILGVMLGYKQIPEIWKSGLAAVSNKKFSYTDFTFPEIVESTQKRAIALVEKNGGRLEGDRLIVRTQSPKPAELELWDDYGSPAERIPVTDARWSWSDRWEPRTAGGSTSRAATEFSAETTVSFEGTGAIVVGPYLPTGGKLEVHLDGKLDRVVDVYSDERHTKGDESVWHAFNLKSEKHTIRIVVLGEPYGDSAGTDVVIDELIVFR